MLPEDVRHKLAQHANITIDLPNQTVNTDTQQFHFDIDPTWKNKFINGLDDIAITLQYEDLIKNYEKRDKKVGGTMTVTSRVSAQEVDDAYLRIKDVVKETPLQYDRYLSQKYQCNVYLKREDLQWVRSFKLRGAYNAISVLSEADKAKGITCASAGNHAQGVAYTAKQLKLKAVILCQ